MIIIEGVDRVGKTTLGKHLSDLYNIPIVRLNRPSDFGATHSERHLDGLADARACASMALNGLSFILDRAYPSELVYATVSGRPTDYDAYMEIDAQLASVAKIFYIEPPEEIGKRWTEAGLDHQEYLGQLIEAYREFLPRFKVPVYIARFIKREDGGDEITVRFATEFH